MTPRFYKLTDLTVLLGLSESTVRRMASAREIPGRVVFRGAVRFSALAVNEWLDSMEAKARHGTNGTIPTAQSRRLVDQVPRPDDGEVGAAQGRRDATAGDAAPCVDRVEARLG